MAIYRNVQMSFWTDPKVLEDFTPSERLLYLFLLTGPDTNLAGCYRITAKQIAFFTGLNKVDELMRSLQEKHKVIFYDSETREVLIVNWWKYNWTSSPKFRTTLHKMILMVQNESFRQFLLNKYNGTDTVSEGYGDGIDTISVPVPVTDPVSVTDSDTVTEVIEHLNEVCGTNYKALGKQNREHVHARLEDGFTKDDCFEVIDKMHEKWGNDPKMRDYLRPQTLFSTKFESYLNMPRGDPKDAVNDYFMGVINGGLT